MLLLVAILLALSQPTPLATSLLGQPLAWPAPTDPARQSQLEADLARAQADFDTLRTEDTFIWLGRRLAYLGRIDDAIATYTKGLEAHPESYRLLRHRGHRYITLRKLDPALADLTRAAELMQRHADAIEPDGAPNASGVARSSDHSNIYYHLGLVQYLQGDYGAAEQTFAKREGLAAYNDDMLVSTTHWRYLALRRLGRDKDASLALEPIHENMDILENDGYHRLCMMYKGLLKPDEVLTRKPDGSPQDSAIAYGVAAFRAISGDNAGAQTLLKELAASPNWPSFGVLAAEADLKRQTSASETATEKLKK